MLRIAVELALHEPLLRGVRREVLPAHAVDRRRHGPRRRATRTRCGTRRTASSTTCCGCRTAARNALKVRSMVGLLPLAAVAVFEEDILAKLPKFRERAQTVHRRAIPSLPPTCICPTQPGVANRRMLSIVDETKLRRILARMLDENEFLGPHGIRALSRFHLEHPYVFHARRAGVSRGLRARRIRHRHVRRQLQLARAGLDAGQLPALHRAAAPVRLLRRRLQGRVPDRLRADDDPVEVAQELARAPEPASSCATRPAAGRSTARRTKFSDDPHWRDWCCSTSTSTATPAPASAPATRPAGPDAWPRSSRPTPCSRKELLLGGQRGEVRSTMRFGREATAKSPSRDTSMNNYYSDMNLPEPAVPAVQALTLLKGQIGAGHRRQLRHRPRDRHLARTGRRRRGRELCGQARGSREGRRGNPCAVAGAR